MKITFLQLTLLLSVLASAMAREVRAQAILKQTTSLNETNVTLNDVLKKLEREYKINFVYSTQLVDVSKRVNVFAQQRPLEEVLEQTLKPLSLIFEASGDVIVIRKLKSEASVSAQSTTASRLVQSVTGKVVDEKTGQPLSGVTVKVKGSTTGATTNVNGIYNVTVNDPSATLVFSFVGYEEQEKLVGQSAIINVVLREKDSKLNEVVVIGYASEKKSQVTGAISSIKAKDLQDQQFTRFDDALRGQVAGVNVIQSSGAPGSTPTVKIRGTTSINSSNPLYVIDGIVIDNGGLDNINPADIESIDVLKDASAAIYGSRASAGVVIVTTKKGKLGVPQLTYNGYYGVQNSIKRLKLANATQYADLRNQALTNDGKAAAFTNTAALGNGTDWQDVLFGKNVPIQNHNLSISGANDKASYYTSFGYLGNRGVAAPSIANYQRLNLALNTSYKVASWLTIGENLNIATSKSQLALSTNTIGANGPLSSAILLDPITPVVVTDINAQPNATVYKNNAQYIVYNDQGQPYGISPYIQNEAANIAAYVAVNQGNYSWATNLIGNTYVELRPITGLTLRSQISIKAAYYGGNSFTPMYFFSSSSNNITATVQNLSSSRNATLNWDNTATYNRKFGQHSATLLVGTSMQNQNGHGLSGAFTGEPVNTFAEASPNFSLAAANKVANGSDNQPYKLASFFGRASYNYAEKYLLDVTLRRDGSSKFGQTNQYGVFPSAGLGYIISKEPFFPKDNFVDFLKLRASYGVLGNEQSLGLFQYTSVIGSGSNYLFGNSVANIGYRPNGLSNPDLKWEQVKITNLGLDAVMFGSLNVSVEAYRKLTEGMLQQIVLPNYIGTSSNPYANIGNLENKGIELSLSYANKIGKFSYSAGGNISYNKNVVTYLGTTQYYTNGNLRGTSYELERTSVGQPFQSYYGFVEQGVFHSQADVNAYNNAAGTLIQPNAKPGDFKWSDINGDGKIDANDRTYLGNSIAPYTYGVNLTAAYNHFDFRLFGQGVWGNKLFQDTHRPDYPTANYRIEALNAWSVSNPDSNYPRLSDVDPNNNFKNPSNFFLQSGAYFRLKTLQLGYSLPQDVLNKIHMKRSRIFVSSNNLFTITKYTGYDPEIAGGIDSSIYPQARTFMVGLDITL
ncbi:TonB-dependent receptor [Mucilaginibacter sp. PAMB04168]|uniref:TonB-dependent receptor n=1 Tax=Mucilaginibacter sp. PAMB04168 TaxID=3138567 RepID=UPI0031F6C4C7